MTTLAIIPGPVYRRLEVEPTIQNLTVQGLDARVPTHGSSRKFTLVITTTTRAVPLTRVADGVLRMTQQAVAHHLGRRAMVARLLRDSWRAMSCERHVAESRFAISRRFAAWSHPGEGMETIDIPRQTSRRYRRPDRG